MSNSLALRRRTFLNFGLLGAAVSAALPVKAFAQAPANVSFIAPTADNPIRINFNENALGMSPSAQAAARDAVAKETVTLKQRLHSFTQSSVTCITCRRIFSS